MDQGQFLYSIFQAVIFAAPVGAILIVFGRKLQRQDQIERRLDEHIQGAENRQGKRRDELERIYNRINAISETLNYIRGKIEGGKL